MPGPANRLSLLTATATLAAALGGTILRLPPAEAERFAELLWLGQAVSARGRRPPRG